MMFARASMVSFLRFFRASGLLFFPLDISSSSDSSSLSSMSEFSSESMSSSKSSSSLSSSSPSKKASLLFFAFLFRFPFLPRGASSSLDSSSDILPSIRRSKAFCFSSREASSRFAFSSGVKVRSVAAARASKRKLRTVLSYSSSSSLSSGRFLSTSRRVSSVPPSSLAIIRASASACFSFFVGFTANRPCCIKDLKVSSSRVRSFSSSSFSR
mmetsp:Transcript_14091/g.25186  ORF Transcript_14091/g.25186 Transcript_14091/m.25186 type:complete len:213 (+) Transcript_14091:1662-2300(+)